MTWIANLATSVLGVLAAATAGCGGSSGNTADGSKFLGTYAVTSHSDAHDQGTTVACSDPGTPVEGGRPYLRIEVDPVLMDDGFLTLDECNDAAATDCTDSLISLEPGGPGLEDESANTQTGGGVICQLYYAHAQATLDGAVLHLESQNKFAAPDISSSACTLARAEALADSPDCLEVERWDATRL